MTVVLLRMKVKCFRNLALEKPAKWSQLVRETYNVALRPLLVTDPSVTVQRVSEGREITMPLWLDKKSCTDLNLSVHWRPVRAHSRGSMMFEQLRSTRLRTAGGGGHDTKAAIRYELADNLPWDRIQPRMEVVLGQMTVFWEISEGCNDKGPGVRVVSCSGQLQGYRHHSRAHLQV